MLFLATPKGIMANLKNYTHFFSQESKQESVQMAPLRLPCHCHLAVTKRRRRHCSLSAACAPDGRSLGLTATRVGSWPAQWTYATPFLIQVMGQASGHSNGPRACFSDRVVPTAMGVPSVTCPGHRPLAQSARGTGRSLPMCLLASLWDRWHVPAMPIPRQIAT